MFYLAARDLLYADFSNRIVYTRPLLHHGRVLDLSFVVDKLSCFTFQPMLRYVLSLYLGWCI